MGDNAGSCVTVKFEPSERIDDGLQKFAEDFFAVVSVDYTEDGKRQLTGYLKDGAPAAGLPEAAAGAGVALPPYKTETLYSSNWLTENVIKFPPVSVAGFLIYGTHEKNINAAGRTGIRLYAATAFGSDHPTTKCCLRALRDIKRSGSGVKKVLDMGTGTGILAIAAAKLWSGADIVAADIDDESVRVAESNAADNGVSGQIKAVQSDGYASEAVRSVAPCDVVLANILARPLISMAGDTADCLAEGGYAVLSGFTAAQTEWVTDAYKKYGFEIKKIYKAGVWRAALLVKGANK